MDESRLLGDIRKLAAEVPSDRLLYHIRPAEGGKRQDWEGAVASALRRPIGRPPLKEMVAAGDRAVILADDLTRPTPQKQLLPPLIDCLNRAGVPDGDITIIVAVGTHRYMTEAEMRERFGEEVCSRLAVLNHAWQEPETFVHLGSTPSGTPVEVNRAAYEADVLIGTGSIVPHVYAGWSGGAKILQPGICSPETTARTHCMAAEDRDLLGIAARTGNAPRREIEQVAALAGLDFVVNVVSDASGAAVWAGAGDPVQAHRAGVAASRRVYVRGIPGPADVAIVDARPATRDYWQGVKALAHACRGVKRGGTLILVGEFPDGVAPTHPELLQHALRPYESIVRGCETGEISDRIASATLRLHALIARHASVICVSSGMSSSDKKRLGFRHAGTVRDALRASFEDQGEQATVGIIEHAGDVLPKVRKAG